MHWAGPAPPSKRPVGSIREPPLRPTLVLLHRWFGLVAAIFLFIAGSTGALIAWDHELDGLLNPRFHEAQHPERPALSPLELAARFEASDPRLRVRYMPLALEPGEALSLFVEPRVDPASGQLHDLGFDEVVLDPATGEVQGKRRWGIPSLARENVMSFLYRLHYSLHLGDPLSMLPLGMLLMGIVAVAWTIDAFVAIVLSFPSKKTWRKSFLVRTSQGAYRFNFDLHRAAGVWAWPLLLVLAVSAVALNLGDQVMRPLVSLFSPLAEDPMRRVIPEAGEPKLERADAIERAREAATARGIVAPPGSVFYASLAAAYGVGFHEPGAGHGDEGLGVPWLYVDARSGELLGAHVPGEGSAGDVFMQIQFPLHSGRIAGLPGRILVSLLGLLVATLSVTGVIIWARKRIANERTARARVASAALRGATDP